MSPSSLKGNPISSPFQARSKGRRSGCGGRASTWPPSSPTPSSSRTRRASRSSLSTMICTGGSRPAKSGSRKMKEEADGRRTETRGIHKVVAGYVRLCRREEHKSTRVLSSPALPSFVFMKPKSPPPPPYSTNSPVLCSYKQSDARNTCRGKTF